MKKIFILIISLIVFACKEQTELEESIFIPDPDFPHLPAYSELGYNTFGANYDSLSFTSGEFKVISAQGNTQLVFAGYLSTLLYELDSLTMTLTIANTPMSAWSDAFQLGTMTPDLTDPKYSLTIRKGGITYPASVFPGGEFVMIRAQHVLVDDQPQEVILSGTFNFKILVNQATITVANGRFDVGVDSVNFSAHN